LVHPSAATPHLAVAKHWTRSIQAALVHVMSLAHYALVHTRSWAVNSSNDRARLSAKKDQLDQEIRLLREEIRIKNERLARIPASQRPHYRPTERLAILELRALRGWSMAQTARVFQVTPATIASWCKRLDEQGPAALLRTPVPVNKFPEFVGHVVRRLQVLCPRLGKVKIAQVLARAGLHLGVSSVGRMRRQRLTPGPTGRVATVDSARRLTTSYPNHLWHADLTTVPTSAGFWSSWLPFALPQCWPFCWWVAVVLDHYSRRVLGFRLFLRQPTSKQITRFLGEVVARGGTAPRHLVTDQGKQFCSQRLKQWCRRHAIRQRFGAVGKRGSIAVVERFIRTLKESTRALTMVSLRRRSFHLDVQRTIGWYNADRPHMTLQGATPDEVYLARRPACRSPRFEPRPGWPRVARCAKPQVLVKGQSAFGWNSISSS
jgi:putative transposase